MIFRRVKAHIEKENWFAVALDFLIVVVGILIAFQITNWSTDREERAQEVQYLSAMKRDVKSSVRVLGRSIGDLEIQQKARQGLYEFYGDTSAVLENDELDRLVSMGVFGLERAELNQITFETLKSSGQMSVIKSTELVVALQELNADIEKAEVDKAEDFQFTFRTSDPLLMSAGDFDNILIHDLSSAQDRLPWVTKQPGAGYNPAVVRSQHFKNIVLYKSLIGQLRLEGYRKILEKHITILALIDERQSELGTEP